MGALRPVADEEGIRVILRSIAADRLIVFCGAGMSMGPPTKLPSAAALANELATKYEISDGATLAPDLHEDLEAFAKFVWVRGELQSHLISNVPWSGFRRKPNPAHTTVADLLLAKGVRATVSANYDTHIEDAAAALGEGDFERALDGDRVNVLPDRYRALLKLHGCVHERMNTVWLKEQLDVSPIQERMSRSKLWASSNLRHRDLLFVGFWSDWHYLNAILEGLVTEIEPASELRVIVLDPQKPDNLKRKASRLWQWATDAKEVDFIHIQAYAEEFMDEVRIEVAHQFLRRLFHNATETYRGLAGEDPPDRLGVNGIQSSRGLYNLRRDLTGAAPDECVSTLDPSDLPLLGAILLRLVERGAKVEGPVIRLGSRTLRLVSGANQLMSRVRARFERTPPGGLPVDRVICVGAMADAAVANVVRGGREASQARPRLGKRWETPEALVSEIFPEAQHETA